MEAELRRRIRMELAQAREDGDGELDDATLAGIIARAVAMGLGWHLDAPEHTRNATLSSRSWRPAAGPRGGPRREFEERDDRGFQPRAGGPRREFEERDDRGFQPRSGGYKPRGGGGGYKPRGASGGFKRGPRRPPRSR